MFLSVRNMDIRKQAFPTSCWISAAHFVLQYAGADVSLATLHGQFYNPDPTSVFVMSGAGHPQKILNEYAFDSGHYATTLNPQTASKATIVDAIVDSIRRDVPVIASIRSTQIAGFGHAVLITAVNTDTGTIAFKDPGTGSTPRPFGLDIRTVQYNEFVAGFSYRYHRTMKTQIFCYCSQIIYLRPFTAMSLFD